MADQSSLYSNSDKVKKALVWLSEAVGQQGQEKRTPLLQEAVIRFDLSPADCAFLEKNFSATGPAE